VSVQGSLPRERIANPFEREIVNVINQIGEIARGRLETVFNP
jgi:2-oxo-4-hydroxy-4-carboxy--5-ureidoimidazoline (OHCU) decarboxylase